MTESLNKLARESRLYRRKRSGQQYFSLLTARMFPGLVVLLTAAFLGRLLWPPLIYSIALAPFWIMGVAAYLLRKSSLWAVPLWRAVALADLRSGSQGTLMAVEEAPDEEWPARLGSKDPGLRVNLPWRQSMTWFIGIAAAVTVMLLPDLRPRPSARPIALTPLDRVEDMVTVLKEEDLADEEYLEQVEEMLEELRHEVRQSLAAEDWQALDNLREELKRQTLSSYQECLERRDAFADLLAELDGTFDGEERSWKELADTLGSMEVDQAADLCLEGAPVNLPPEALSEFLKKCQEQTYDFTEEELALLKELAELFKLTPEQLERLNKALAEMDPSKLANLSPLTEEEIRELLDKLKAGELSFTEKDFEKLLALLEAGEEKCEGT